MARYDFNYDKYKEEAVKNKNPSISIVKQNAAARKESGRKVGPDRTKRKEGAPKSKTTPVGSAFPYIRSSFGWNRYGIRELEETARVAPVARSLWQLQLVAFPYFDFNIVAPRGVEVSEKDKERLLPKMEEIDRQIDTANCCKQTMYDVMTYGSAFFEIVWGEDEEGWLCPIALQRLPAASFKQSPTFVTGNTTRYQCGNLLKGVVLDKEKNVYHYYQLQDENSGIPVEIPAGNIIHIKDQNSTFVDGEPYLAGIVSTIAQLEFVRKRMMQTISRVGSPQMKVTVGVPKEYLEMAGGLTGLLPGEDGTLGDGMLTQLWGFGSALAENHSSDTAICVPNGVDVDWQRPTVPINPTDPDAYLIKEAVSHIFPRDVLEVLSTSMSTTAPLLDLLKIMVQGWQQICSIPFENQLWTKFLMVNGFKMYRAELEWAPLIPEDPKVEEEKILQRNLQLFDRHVITLEETREALGLDTENMEKLKEILYDEMLKYKVPQSMMQQPGMYGGFGGAPGAAPTEGQGEAPAATEAPVEGEAAPTEGEAAPEDDAVLSEGEALLAELESMGLGGE